MAGFSVFHNVPMYQQPSTNVCWYTCYQMVVAYERGRNRGQGLRDPSEVQFTQDRYNQNGMVGNDPNPQERGQVAGMLGFACDYSSMGAEGMLGLLAYAPVLYDGRWAGGQNGHMVVFVGLSDQTLAYNDPADASGRQSMDYNRFMSDLQQTRSRALIYPP